MKKFNNEEIDKIMEFDNSDLEKNLRNAGISDHCPNNYYYGNNASTCRDRIFSAPDKIINSDNLVLFKRLTSSSVMFTSPYYDVQILECILNARACSDLEGTIECLKSIRINMYKRCRDILESDKAKTHQSQYAPVDMWAFDTYLDIRTQAELLCDAFWMSGSWYSEYLNNPLVFGCALYMLAEDLIEWFENYKADNATTKTRKPKSTKDND